MKLALLLLVAAVSSVLCTHQVEVKNGGSVCRKYVHLVSEQRFLLHGNRDLWNNFRESICVMIKENCEDYQRKMTYVLALVKNKFQPEEICSLLHPTPGMRLTKLSVKTSAPCVACKVVVEVIKFDLNVLKYSAEKVKEGIEEMCKLLAPLKVQKEICNDIVDYIDDIIQWILNGTSPEGICEKLKLCTNETNIHKNMNITFTTTSSKSKHFLQTFVNKWATLGRKLIQHPLHKVFKHPWSRRYNPFWPRQQHFTPWRPRQHPPRPFWPRRHPFRPGWPRHHPFKPRHHPFRPRHHPFRPHHRGVQRRIRPHHHHRHHHRHHHSNHSHGNHTHGNHSRHHHHFHPHPHGNHSHHHHFHPHHHHSNYTDQVKSKVQMPYWKRIMLSLRRRFTAPKPVEQEQVTDTDNSDNEEEEDGDGDVPNESEEDGETEDFENGDEEESPEEGELEGSEDEIDDEPQPEEESDVIEEEVPLEEVEPPSEEVEPPIEPFIGSRPDDMMGNSPSLETVDDMRLPAHDEPHFKLPHNLLGGDYKKFHIPDITPPKDEFPEISSEEGEGDEEEEEEGGEVEGMFGGGFNKLMGGVNRLMKTAKQEMKTIPELDFASLREDVGGGLFGDIFKNPFFKNPIIKNPIFGGNIFENIESEVEKMTKDLEENVTKALTGLKMKGGITCTLCKTIVTFIDWEVKTVNASVEFIENAVKGMCKLYPIKIATEVCDLIVEKCDEIIQLIEKGVEPGAVCQRLGLCNSTLPDSVKSVTIVAPTEECSPLCKFMKTLNQHTVMKSTGLMEAAKNRLSLFCEENKIEAKCDNLMYIFNKTERQLSAVVTYQGEVGCKCFKKQPLYKCQVCKQFEKGTSNDLKEAYETLDFLGTRLYGLCRQLPEVQSKCNSIVEDIRASVIHLKPQLQQSAICEVIGYCSNETRTMAEYMRKTMRKMLPGGGLLLRGMPMGFNKRFSFGCNFCKSCVENLEETFARNSQTGVEKILPAVKDGLAIFCETKGDGEEITSVCKSISDGMERVHNIMKKTKDGEMTCKVLGVC